MFHFFNGVDIDLGQVFNEDSLVRTLLEIHPSLDILAQEVVNFFVVDFDETASNQVGLA